MSAYDVQNQPPLGEQEEMEAAAELLEATNEQELDHFLNRFLRRRDSRRGRRSTGPMTRALGGWVKGAMRRILPGLGRYGRRSGYSGYSNYQNRPGYSSYSGYPTYPDYPTDSGSSDDSGDSDDSEYSNYPRYPRYPRWPGWRMGQLAPGAGQMLGLEMEGLSAEDQEFTAARQLVRLADAAAGEAAVQPDPNNPTAAAEQAMARAAQMHAPGLLRSAGSEHPPQCGSTGTCHCHGTDTGRWVQHGNRIILHGV